MNEKKGILIVSFGTSYDTTRAATIGAIEQAIKNAYPHLPVYSAWTSQMIIAKLLRTTGEKIMNVTEALQAMHQDGITHVFIQTTHVIPGIEFEQLKEDAQKLKTLFASVSFGMPLLSSTEDMLCVTGIIGKHFSDICSGTQTLCGNKKGDSALVLMGHGTEHPSNTSYAALDYMFKEQGYANIYVGTVEAYPSLDEVLHLLKDTSIRHIHLAPLMIVAGDHANNDMAGADEDSWTSRCQSAGYTVTCHLKGLGESPEIHQMFLQHLRRIID